jgi:hypothetical protein
VYGPARHRWLAFLLKANASWWLLQVTLCAVVFDGLTALSDTIIAVVPITAVPVALWIGLGVARLTAPHVWIIDRYHWEQVDQVCADIGRYLPGVSALSRKEVRSATDAARWELACLIRDRSRLEDLRRDTERSAARLAVDDPLRDELAQRRAVLTQQLESIGAEAERRIGRLRSLAAQSKALATEEAEARRGRAAADRARRTLARADAGIADTTAWGTRTDPAAEFAERAENVLAAYRELTGDPDRSDRPT